MKSNIIKTAALGLVFCASSMLGWSSDAGATNGNNLTVSRITISASGTLGFVEVNGTVQNQCASPNVKGFAFDYSTTKGQALLQLLTAAQLSGKRLNIFSDSTCVSIGIPGSPPANVHSIVHLQLSE